MKNIKVFLVDDHKIFREGIRNLLEQQSDLTVIGEAEDGRAGVELIHNLTPDIVIMDVTMPNLNGIDATRQILQQNKDIKVLALSMHSHKRLVKEILKAGASGYLLKECAFGDLIQAIHLVTEKNQVYLCPEISRLVMDDYLQQTEKGTKPEPMALTPKEREILQLIAEGKTSRGIAKILNMSVRTVEKHRLNLTQKLNIKSVAELVKYAIREGLTNP